MAAFPDESFYPAPRLAMQAPPEGLAYVTLANPMRRGHPDAVGVIDVNPRSRQYGTLVGQVDMPHVGDELHPLAWNACSSSLAPCAASRVAARRYLLAAGLRSSRLHVIDTEPDPLAPRIVRVVTPERLIRVTGYARPHLARPAIEGVFVSALGSHDCRGPGGLFLLDGDSLEPKGRWELDRGPQSMAGDLAWHPAADVLITSEWGPPDVAESGPALSNGAAARGHRLHVWDRPARRHVGVLDLGPTRQIAPVLCAAHDPSRTYGFTAASLDVADLSASIWLWERDAGGAGAPWRIEPVVTLPALEHDGAGLPPILADRRLVPPLVTGLSLSLDDRWLYVACWGSGDVHRYDVSNPRVPRLASSLRLGGITARGEGESPRRGGPRSIEVSRDGRRAYVTNGFHAGWSERFYPEPVAGWMAKLDLLPDGGMCLDRRFRPALEAWRPQQVRLQGGDASSDVFCYA